MQKQATKPRATRNKSTQPATTAPSAGIENIAPLDSSVAPAIVAAQAEPVKANKTQAAHETAEKHAFGLAYRYIMRNEPKSRLPIKAGNFAGFGVFRGSKPSMRSASVIIALCAAHNLPLRAGVALPLNFNGFSVESGASSDTVARYAIQPAINDSSLIITESSVKALRAYIGDKTIAAVNVTL